ncbi:MAG: hypothetical protein LBJ10_02465 [Clostridiales bacterium]|nr:hypothetical protein [Clostridiales bacterium]
MNLLKLDLPSIFAAFGKYFFSVLIVYYFMHRLLPNRLNIFALVALSSVYALWSCFNLWSYSGASSLFGTAYHFWMNMFINAWTYFIIIFLFQGKFWRKLIVWVYFDVCRTMCESVAYVPVLLYYASHGIKGDWAWIVSSVESDVMLKLLYLSAMLPLFLLLCFLSLAIWRGILMRKFHPYYLLFIALPLGLRYSLGRVFRPGMGDWFLGIIINFVPDLLAAYDILTIFGVAISLAASVAILFYALSQDKRAAIEAELRETKRAMELEQARYGEIERRGEELAKIRHDFNNQLASIVQLVRAGEGGTAQEIISALSEEINGARTGE